MISVMAVLGWFVFVLGSVCMTSLAWLGYVFTGKFDSEVQVLSLVTLIMWGMVVYTFPF